MQIGWNFVIETTNGDVGLWSSWLENGFRIFYPLDVKVPDELIMDILDVEYAKPVKNELFGTRLWEKYYSKRVEPLGRVWIGQTDSASNGYCIKVIQDKRIKRYYGGHSATNTILTNEFTFCSEEEPDAPNADSENIMPYKDKFIKLFVEIAKLVGEIKAVNLDSGAVLYTPEKLYSMGYDIQMRSENGTDYCYIKDEEKNIEIMLKSGNSLVSWVTVIRYLANNNLTDKDLINLLDSFDNSKDFVNFLPLVEDMLKKEAMYCKN